MKEPTIIEVGIRIDPTTGMGFFGIEAVNQQLAAGRRVKELRPAGVIMSKVGETDGNVRLTLTGCKIEVAIEDV